MGETCKRGLLRHKVPGILVTGPVLCPYDPRAGGLPQTEVKCMHDQGPTVSAPQGCWAGRVAAGPAGPVPLEDRAETEGDRRVTS